MRKGSIGIFAVLIMMLVASVLFVLLETTRCKEIHRLSNLQTQVALESAFANYQSTLWEDYGLLGCEVSQLEDHVLEGANYKKETSLSGLNLLKFDVEDFETQGYTLLTDGGGLVYEQAVAASMKDTMLYGAAKEIFNQYEVIKNLETQSGWSPLWLTNGLSQELADENDDIENPMIEVINIQNKGILELLIEDTNEISNKSLNIRDAVSHRDLAKGKNPVIPENDWLNKVLLQQYILQNMSNYSMQVSDDGMDYEVEYVIAGKGSDAENLKYVVNRLLFLREMTNFLYLTSNPIKIKEAGSIALALAGVSVNPLVVEIVKMGIVAAWAFGESVLDVRALLQGKKIPLLKSESTWTLEISQIGSIDKGYLTAKECENGLSYQQYLGVMLLFLQDGELSMRAMDVQEAAIRMKDEMDGFRMDEILVQAKMRIDYYSLPVFLSFYQLDVAFPEIYCIKTEKAYGYY